jgi:hypothetical protein
MGQMPFRVKSVPNPEVQIAGKPGGSISKNQLKTSGGLKAVMKNFDFELEFTITAFTITATFAGFEDIVECNSANFDKKALEFIERLKNGQKVYFEGIKAVGPSGDVRPLPTVSFKIN